MEQGETPEETLLREIKEELNITPTHYQFWKEYNCTEGDSAPNTKYVFYAKTDAIPEELILTEGQRLTSIYLHERSQYRFANILARIVDDFAESTFAR